MFSFIDTAYSVSIILLLLCLVFTKKIALKNYINNAIATCNHLLIFYSWYLCKKFYDIIAFILSLDLPPINPKQKIVFSFDDLRYLLLVILPYFFLIKKISANIIFTICMLVLIQWNFLQEILKSIFQPQQSSGILWYLPYLVEYKILHFISLFMAVYALLWLLKRMPKQLYV